jgi:hypothetical protein
MAPQGGNDAPARGNDAPQAETRLARPGSIKICNAETQWDQFDDVSATFDNYQARLPLAEYQHRARDVLMSRF